MADVFISYSKKDRELAERVDRALKAAGYTTWWDDNLIPAEQWNQTIVSEITAASAVLAIWTFNSIASDFVRDEADAGRKAKKLVPIRFEEVEPPLGQGAIHLADLRGWQGSADDQRWQQVLTAIQHVIDGAGMRKAAGFGGAFERRLTDVPPFPRPHVPAPSPNDKWVVEREFVAASRGHAGIGHALHVDEEGKLKTVCFWQIFSNITHMTLVGPYDSTIHIKHDEDIETCALIGTGGMPEILATDDKTLKKYRIELSGSLIKIRNALRNRYKYFTPCDIIKEKFPILSRNVSSDSPLLIINDSGGQLRIIDNVSRRYFKSWEVPEFDWVGGYASGSTARWNADNTVALITRELGHGDGSGYHLLMRDRDSWTTRPVPWDGQSVIEVHPGRMLVSVSSIGNDLSVNFVDIVDFSSIHQFALKGVGRGKGEFPAARLTFSRCGTIGALSLGQFNKILMVDLADGKILNEFRGMLNPQFSPDGQRIFAEKCGDARYIPNPEIVLLPVNGGVESNFGASDMSHGRNTGIESPAAVWGPTADRLFVRSEVPDKYHRGVKITSYKLVPGSS